MALEVAGLSLAVPCRCLLAEVDFAVAAGELVALLGPSGVGKTSLLNCLSGLTRPVSGVVAVDGEELSRLSAAKRAAFRLRRIGMVFQFAELLPELTALDNVALPSRLMGTPRQAAESRAKLWLERLEVSEQAGSHPDDLSGGEQQRVALARALAHEPSLLLADEPTGMLDEVNTANVVALLGKAAREWGSAVVVATHDASVAAAADRVLRISERSLLAAVQEPTGGHIP
ncbi:MAG: ABC transporter ATP-binding protein [Nocardioidaceae bacterium]